MAADGEATRAMRVRHYPGPGGLALCGRRATFRDDARAVRVRVCADCRRLLERTYTEDHLMDDLVRDKGEVKR